jgi:phosphoglucosamine mutase
VATVMSNLGLENFLTAHGLRMERTAVGDRHVVERMRQGGWNLGGEQSGHIVMSDYATTGDGMIAALQFLAAMVETGKPASVLARCFEPVPQMLKNLRYAPGVDLLSAVQVQAAIEDAKARLAGRGRLADPQIRDRAFGARHGRMRR